MPCLWDSLHTYRSAGAIVKAGTLQACSTAATKRRRYNLGVLLCYITDRRQFPGTERQKRERLLEKIAEAALAGVDFIQLREKDLPPRELVELAREALRRTRNGSAQAQHSHVSFANVGHQTASRSQGEPRNSKLLINSRVDVALAVGADGVHLTSTDIPASDARAVWASAVAQNSTLETRNWIVAVSCHTPDEVRLAESHGADFAVFAPVFEKVVPDGIDGGRRTVTRHAGGEGLAQLREACRAPGRPVGPEGIGTTRMPVLALGGITLGNAAACIEAGAAGVAAIRLFQDNDVASVTEMLRNLAVAQLPELAGGS